LGFNLTTAINTFVRQALREQAIPFQPKLLKNPQDSLNDSRIKNSQEAERHKVWLKTLDNAISQSAGETIMEMPRSNAMRDPVNLFE